MNIPTPAQVAPAIRNQNALLGNVIAGHNLTEHARHRMVQRGVSAAGIELTLVNPDIVYGGHEDGEQTFKRGELVVVTGNPDFGTRRQIETVFWQTPESTD